MTSAFQGCSLYNLAKMNTICLPPDKTQRLLEALEVGCTRRLAFLYAGISRGAFDSRMSKGREALEKQDKGEALTEYEVSCMHLVESVELAEATTAFSWLQKVVKAADTKWQAAAWLLERRFPADFGRKQADVSVSVFNLQNWQAERHKRLEELQGVLVSEVPADCFLLPTESVPQLESS